MKLFKLTLAALALSTLAACGGGDTEDRLDVANPKVRFVDAARLSAGVTLYRNDVGQSDANKVGYKYASHYFDMSLGDATWSIRPAASTATQLASVSFDADRGDRKQSSPSSGNDSIEYPGGSHQLRVTTAGTKTVIFTAVVNIADNADWLLVPIPTADTGAPVAGDIKLLLVEGNSDNTVTSEIISSP